MNNTTMTPNRTINQIMNEGDASSLILKYKNVLIGVVLFVIGLLVGYALYADRSSQNLAESSAKIYKFETEVIKNFNQSLDPKNLLQAFKNLHSATGSSNLLIPVALKSSDLLVSKGFLGEALEILNLAKDSAKSDYAKYFLLTRTAVLYEDLGDNLKAIETLELMSSSKVKLFEGKIYLDLGRLYLKKGDKDKAKASFNYVVEKAKDDSEFVKLAKIYLSKI